MKKDELAALARQLLTYVAGILTSRGLLDADGGAQLIEIAGPVIAIGSLAWSIHQKRRQRQFAEAARQLPAFAPVEKVLERAAEIRAQGGAA